MGLSSSSRWHPMSHSPAPQAVCLAGPFPLKLYLCTSCLSTGCFIHSWKQTNKQKMNKQINKWGYFKTIQNFENGWLFFAAQNSHGMANKLPWAYNGSFFKAGKISKHLKYLKVLQTLLFTTPTAVRENNEKAGIFTEKVRLVLHFRPGIMPLSHLHQFAPSWVLRTDAGHSASFLQRGTKTMQEPLLVRRTRQPAGKVSPGTPE